MVPLGGKGCHTVAEDLASGPAGLKGRRLRPPVAAGGAGVGVTRIPAESADCLVGLVVMATRHRRSEEASPRLERCIGSAVGSVGLFGVCGLLGPRRAFAPSVLPSFHFPHHSLQQARSLRVPVEPEVVRR